ncbi:fatty acid-binding protein [Corynebacterium atypicum]|uniref:Ferric nitrobindin-like protein n=1 Tax=Corynebacterium atypicum TaxID=191610 RepID=A0ABM5QPA5_9CORY|nr:FABP family protein [Corynebacterium atypicum]AIG64641.1 fatty acid-binding protein [Corynebacterium atypicum]
MSDQDKDAPTLAAHTLNGNEAVNLAAEQAKETAKRNIPDFSDLPISADTANLRQGPNIHDGLLALLPLVGVWRGTGQADTPEGGEYAFGQELTFAHDGENYLVYSSRIWRIDERGEAIGPDQRETGFWRIDLEDHIEITSAQSLGAVEIFYGAPISERAWQVESASTMVTENGPKTLGPGKRLYGLLPNNNLGWVDERMIDGELHPRMSAELARYAG